MKKIFLSMALSLATPAFAYILDISFNSGTDSLGKSYGDLVFYGTNAFQVIFTDDNSNGPYGGDANGVHITNLNYANIKVGTTDLVLGAFNSFDGSNNFHSSGIVATFSQGVDNVSFFDTDDDQTQKILFAYDKVGTIIGQTTPGSQRIFQINTTDTNGQLIYKIEFDTQALPVGGSNDGTFFTLDDFHVEYTPENTYVLTVAKSGTGSGTVTSAPTGINCGATCNANFVANTNVILTAAPATTSNFVNWSGACSVTAVTCTVAMTAATSVTATFNLIPVITPPTAITNAASNITVNSAKLNGSVKSNGATAAVSFDFGVTTAYGTSIAATPGNVFSNTAVAVAATKTGLTCGTTYHYRVKAVNSKGTRYGADKIFATTACRRDLVITAVTLTPATPVANGTFNVAVTVKNAGTATSNIGFFVDVWANSAAVPSCGAEGDGWVETPMLAAGASRTVTVTGLNVGTAGAKTLRAFVDSWCEVVESNEANNQMVKAYSVQ